MHQGHGGSSALAAFDPTRVALRALREELRAELQTEMAQLRREIGELRGQVSAAAGASARQERDSPRALQCAEKVALLSRAGLSTEGSAEDQDSSSGDEQRPGTKVASFLEQEYAFEESCWDAGLFVGLDEIGGVQNLMLLSGLVVNTVLQLAFATFIWQNLTEPSFTPEVLASIRKWRLMDGHSVSMASELKHIPLVRRMCGGDSSLTVATAQKNMTEGLTAWLEDSNAVLCALALVLWTLVVLNELLGASYFFRAIHAMPRSAATVIRSSGDGLSVSSLHVCRKALGGGIAVFRFGIAILLLYAGSLWLINTDSAADLILNASALSFVLECDELVHKSLSPAGVKQLIRILEPMKVPKWQRPITGKGLALLPWLFLSVFVGGVIMHDLVPTMASMNEAYHWLCGGQLDFVYEVDALGRMSFSKTSLDKGMIGAEEARLEIVSQVVNADDQAFGRYTGYPFHVTKDRKSIADFVPIQRLLDIGKRKTAQIVKTKGACIDDTGLDIGGDLYVVTGDLSISNCSGVAPYCLQTGIPLVRMLCPQTCGCSSPTSGLMRPRANPNSWAGEDGCPVACYRSLAWNASMGALPCVDTSAKQLRAGRGWAGLIESLKQKMQYLQLDRHLRNASHLLDLMWTEGCGSIEQSRVLVEFCRGGLAAFCPVACRCTASSASRESMCPPACASRAV